MAILFLSSWGPGFDLTTRDSCFTILDEVFTNHILAENTYFTNRTEGTERKIMVLKPANKHKLFDNDVILKTFLSTISTIIYFFIEQKFFKHYF